MSDAALLVQDYERRRQRNIWSTVFCLLGFIALLLLGLHWRSQQSHLLQRENLADYGAVMFELPRTIRPLQLLDQKGLPLSEDFLIGKWTVMFYGFTHCPDICPTTLRELNLVDKQLTAAGLQQQWQAVLVAVDVERDTPDVLAPYLAYFNPRFLGLTGAHENMLTLAADTNAAFGKVYNPDGSYTVDHSSQLVLINPKGDYAGFIKGPVQAARVAPVLQSLIADFATRYAD